MATVDWDIQHHPSYTCNYNLWLSLQGSNLVLWEDNARTLLLTPSHAEDLCYYVGECYTRLRARRYSYSRRSRYVCATRTERYSLLSASEIIFLLVSGNQDMISTRTDCPPRSILQLMGSFGCTDVHVIDGILHCDVTTWGICERTANGCRYLWVVCMSWSLFMQ